MQIEKGSHVRVRTAFNDWVRRRAASGIEEGADFTVVWVCTEDEWAVAKAESREPEAVPGPAEDVQVVEGVSA